MVVRFRVLGSAGSGLRFQVRWIPVRAPNTSSFLDEPSTGRSLTQGGKVSKRTALVTAKSGVPVQLHRSSAVTQAWDIRRVLQESKSWNMKLGHSPAAPNYSLRDPKYHRIETLRPLIEGHGILPLNRNLVVGRDPMRHDAKKTS